MALGGNCLGSQNRAIVHTAAVEYSSVAAADGSAADGSAADGFADFGTGARWNRRRGDGGEGGRITKKPNSTSTPVALIFLTFSAARSRRSLMHAASSSASFAFPHWNTWVHSRPSRE